jgi:hypothetical protein
MVMDSLHSVDETEPLDAGLREDPTLAQDMRTIASQVRRFAEAELAFQKARAAYISSASRTIAVLGIVAIILAVFAVMAAVLGTVIALGPVLGLWGAMAAVTLALLVIAGGCGVTAMARARRMKAVLGEGADNGAGG